MNKITIILLFLSIFAQSQEKQIIKLGTNPKIILLGSYDYDKTPKFSGTFSWVTEFENKNEFGIALEYTELNPYFFTTGFIYNHNLDILNSYFIQTKIGLEVLYLQRGTSNKHSQREFITMGMNGIINLNIIEDLLITSLRLNWKYRPEIKQFSSWGMFFEIGIKF